MNKKIKPSPLPAIGEHLQRERKRRHLSMDELSATSGVSKAMLSQIESGKVNPTIGTMWKIADALSVDFDVLIKGEGSRTRKFEVRTAEKMTRLETDGGNAVFTVLSTMPMAEDLELYLLELQPGCRHESLPHAEMTEEYLTVLEGELHLEAGEKSADLHSGDCILYQSDVNHSLENRSSAPVRAHMVVRFKHA